MKCFDPKPQNYKITLMAINIITPTSRVERKKSLQIHSGFLTGQNCLKLKKHKHSWKTVFVSFFGALVCKNNQLKLKNTEVMVQN